MPVKGRLVLGICVSQAAEIYKFLINMNNQVELAKLSISLLSVIMISIEIDFLTIPRSLQELKTAILVCESFG